MLGHYAEARKAEVCDRYQHGSSDYLDLGSLFGGFLPPEKGVRNAFLRRQLYEQLCVFLSAEINVQFEALRGDVCSST